MMEHEKALIDEGKAEIIKMGIDTSGGMWAESKGLLWWVKNNEWYSPGSEEYAEALKREGKQKGER